MKNLRLAILLFVPTLLSACGSHDNNNNSYNESIDEPQVNTVSFESFMESKVVKSNNADIQLLNHPVKDIIDKYGDGYKINWEESGGKYSKQVEYSYSSLNAKFLARTNFSFDSYDWYNNPVDYRDYNPEEYLSYLIVDEIAFTKTGFSLEGLKIGDSVESICRNNGIDKATIKGDIMENYQGSSDLMLVSYRSKEYFYSLDFIDYRLTEIRVATNYDYIAVNESDINQESVQNFKDALTYINEKGLSNAKFSSYTFKGKCYSSFFDSWFYRYNYGDASDAMFYVETGAPYRVWHSYYDFYEFTNNTFLFWENGSYVNPLATFFGKWRKPNSNDYINIKSITSDGDLVFDWMKNGTLQKNLNVVLNPYFKQKFFSKTFTGEKTQFGNTKDSSGLIKYQGKWQIMSDNFSVDFAETTVTYTSTTGSGGITCTLHIPDNKQYKIQDSIGEMSNFGREDPNLEKNKLYSQSDSNGRALINKYENEAKKTDGLDYCAYYYTYQYDYYFEPSKILFHVWKYNDDDIFLYVNDELEAILTESASNNIEGYLKKLVYKSTLTVPNLDGVSGVWTDNNGLTLSFTSAGYFSINKQNSLMTNYENIYLAADIDHDTYALHCFVEEFGSYILSGFLSYNYQTWALTLHINVSTIPGLDIGVYYLTSTELYLFSNSFSYVLSENTENEINNINETDTTQRIVIRDFYGKILGTIEIKPNGDKTVRNFYGKILGYYFKDTDVTTDASFKVISHGDVSAALLYL